MKSTPMKLMVRYCSYEASKEKTYSDKVFSKSYEIPSTVGIDSIHWIISLLWVAAL